MGEEQRRELARRLADDEEFASELRGAASLEEAAAIARRHGVDVTSADLADSQELALTDRELDDVAGGKHPSMDCDYTTPFDMLHHCSSG